MSRNGSKKSREKPSFGSFLSMARFALAEAGFACDKVIRRVLVAVRAMCFCALPSAVGNTPKSKTGFVNLAAFAQDFFKGGAILRPRNNGVPLQSRSLRQINHKVSFAFYFNFSCYVAVSLLLFLRCPSAIFWRVWAIVINSLNGSSWRSWPHVLHEVIKPNQLCHPPFANVNAAPSVVWISPVVRVSAPFFHGLKANIFRNLCASHTAHFSAT